jgi:hypothetical protein
MHPVADSPAIVPVRELEDEKKPAVSEPPHIRCPLCGWTPHVEDSTAFQSIGGSTGHTPPVSNVFHSQPQVQNHCCRAVAGRHTGNVM